jgi:ribose 1,5-bisphosphokinase PhnN
MQGLLKRIKRFSLKWRIERLRWGIAAATEDVDEAQLVTVGRSAYLDESHRKIRALRAELALLERPEKLLAQALQHRSWR